MESLIIPAAQSIFNVFGFGFLAGAMFSVVIMLVFDWITKKQMNDEIIEN